MRSMLAVQSSETGEDGNWPDIPNNQPLPSWCKCGRCREMPIPTENVCCRQQPCITTAAMFNTNVLNTEVLSISIAIVGRCDDFADLPEYTPTSYRKAAYRQWVMWQHGYLCRHNQKVVPSCVVWAIHNVYPSPDGVYLGFKEY